MVAMAITLETLILEYKADFTGLDRQLDQATNRAKAKGKELENAKPKLGIDTSQLDKAISSIAGVQSQIAELVKESNKNQIQAPKITNLAIDGSKLAQELSSSLSEAIKNIKFDFDSKTFATELVKAFDEIVVKPRLILNPEDALNKLSETVKKKIVAPQIELIANTESFKNVNSFINNAILEYQKQLEAEEQAKKAKAKKNSKDQPASSKEVANTNDAITRQTNQDQQIAQEQDQKLAAIQRNTGKSGSPLGAILSGFSQGLSKDLTTKLARNTNKLAGDALNKFQQDIGLTIPDIFKGIFKAGKEGEQSDFSIQSEAVLKAGYDLLLDQIRSRIPTTTESLARVAVAATRRTQSQQQEKETRVRELKGARKSLRQNRVALKTSIAQYNRDLANLEQQQQELQTSFNASPLQETTDQLAQVNAALSQTSATRSLAQENLAQVNNQLASVEESLTQLASELIPQTLVDLIKEFDPNISSDKLPKLIVDDAGLAEAGARAAAIPSANLIKVSSSLKEAIDSGVLSLEQMEDIFHELQHLADFEFGDAVNLMQQRMRESIDLAGVSIAEAIAVSDFTQQYDPNRQIAEISAETRGRRLAREVSQRRSPVNINAISQLSDLSGTLGNLDAVISGLDLNQEAEDVQRFLATKNEIATRLAEIGAQDITTIDGNALQELSDQLKEDITALLQRGRSLGVFVEQVNSVQPQRSAPSNNTITRELNTSDLDDAFADLISSDSVPTPEEFRSQVINLKDQIKSTYSEMKQALADGDSELAKALGGKIISMSDEAKSAINVILEDVKTSYPDDLAALGNIGGLKGNITRYQNLTRNALPRDVADEEEFLRLGDGFRNSIKEALNSLANSIGTEGGDSAREAISNIRDRVANEAGEALLDLVANLVGAEIDDDSGRTALNIAMSPQGRDLLKEGAVNLAGAFGGGALSMQTGLPNSVTESMIVPVVRKAVTDLEALYVAYNEVMANGADNNEEELSNLAATIKTVTNTIRTASRNLQERSEETRREIAHDVLGAVIGNNAATQLGNAGLNIPLRGAAVAMPTVSLAYEGITQAAQQTQQVLAGILAGLDEALLRIDEESFSNISSALEQLANGADVSLDTIQQALNDLYSYANELSTEGIDASAIINEANRIRDVAEQTFEQPIELEFSIDADQINEEINQTANNAANSPLNGLFNRFSPSPEAINRLRGYGQQLSNLARTPLRNLTSGLTSTVIAGASLIAIPKLIGVTKTLIDTTLDSYAASETLYASLLAIKGLNASFSLSKVRKDAQLLGNDFSKAAQSYTQFSASVAGTNLEFQTDALFSQLQEIASLRKLDDQQFDSALRALNQIGSKGVVQMEELRGQLAEAVPGALQAASRAMNVSIQDLNSLISTGNVMASDFLPKLINQLHEESAAFKAMIPDTVNEKMTRVANKTSELKVKVGELAAIVANPILDATALGLDVAVDSVGIAGTAFAGLAALLLGTVIPATIKTLAHFKLLAIASSALRSGLMLGGVALAVGTMASVISASLRPLSKEFKELENSMDRIIRKQAELSNNTPEDVKPRDNSKPKAIGLGAQIGDFLINAVNFTNTEDITTNALNQYFARIESINKSIKQANKVETAAKLNLLDPTVVEKTKADLLIIDSQIKELQSEAAKAQITEDTKLFADIQEQLRNLEKDRVKIISKNIGINDTTIKGLKETLNGLIATTQEYEDKAEVDLSNKITEIENQIDSLEKLDDLLSQFGSEFTISTNLGLELEQTQSRLENLSSEIEALRVQGEIDILNSNNLDSLANLKLNLEVEQTSLDRIKSELDNLTNLKAKLSESEAQALTSLEDKYSIKLDTATRTELEFLLSKAEGLGVSTNTLSVIKAQTEILNKRDEVNQKQLEILRLEKDLVAQRLKQTRIRQLLPLQSQKDELAITTNKNNLNQLNSQLQSNVTSAAASLNELKQTIATTKSSLELTNKQFKLTSDSLENSFAAANIQWFLQAIGKPTASLSEALEVISQETLSLVQEQAANLNNPEIDEFLSQIGSAIDLRDQSLSLKTELAQSQLEVKNQIRESAIAFRDFYREVEDQLQTTTDEIKQLKNQLDFTRLTNELTETITPGSRGVAKQINQAITSFASNLEGIADGNLSLESEQRNHANTIRDLRERYGELIREIDPTAFIELSSATEELVGQFQQLSENIPAINSREIKGDAITQPILVTLQDPIEVKQKQVEIKQQQLAQFKQDISQRVNPNASITDLLTGKFYDPSRVQGGLPGITPPNLDEIRAIENKAIYDTSTQLAKSLNQAIRERDVAVKPLANNNQINQLNSMLAEKTTIQQELNLEQSRSALNELENSLAEISRDITSGITDARVSIKGFKNSLRDLSIQFGLINLTDVEKAIEDVNKAYDDQIEQIKDFQIGLKEQLEDNEKVDFAPILNQAKSISGVNQDLLSQITSDFNKGYLDSVGALKALLGETDTLIQLTEQQRNKAKQAEENRVTKELNNERNSLTQSLDTASLDALANNPFLEDLEAKKLTVLKERINLQQQLADRLQEIEDLELRNGLTAARAGELKIQAEKIYQQELANTQAQQSLMADMAGTLGSSLSSFIGGIGDSLFNEFGAIQGLLDLARNTLASFAKSIAQTAAQIASQAIIRSIFGSIAGFNNGGIVGNFNNGGMVENFATGGAISGLAGSLAIAMTREGNGAVPIVAKKGEQILSTNNNDAQFYRALKRSGQWDELKNSGVANFNFGGMVGNQGSTATVTRGSNKPTSTRNYKLITTYNITTKDANSFRKSQSQILTANQERQRRESERNG